MKKEKRQIRLDDLLDKSEPSASFHDAAINKITADYENKKLIIEFELCVGNPNEKTEIEMERCRKGHLSVSNLIFWSLELPGNNDKDRWAPLWLTSDGLIDEVKTDMPKSLNIILEPDMYAWYFFFSNINSFGYLASREAEFKWETA